MKKIIKKKVLPLILATTLVLPFIPSNSFADNGADLFNSVSSPAKETTTIFTIGKTDFTIDNKSKIMDAAPIIHKGRTMVPMKYAAESVGADIVWLPKEETAKITLGSRKVSLSLKSNILLINGEKIKMDVEPMIMNGRMFIPVSYIAKAFDLNVKWDEKSQTITMNGSKNEWNGKIDNPAKDPVPSPLVETNEKIFSGVHSTFILTSKGNVKSFGNERDGRLGNGTGQDKMLGNWFKDNQKVQVKNVKEVSVFNGHTMFLVNNGDVYSVGRNVFGTLGDGTTENKSIPVKIQGLPKISKIAAGSHHSLFLAENGEVYVTGITEKGGVPYEIGEKESLIPIKVEGVKNVKDIYANEYNSFFILDDGVYGVGREFSKSSSDADINKINELPRDIKRIEVGTSHIFFIAKNGDIYAMGENENGQLGMGKTSKKQNIPVKLDIKNVKDIAAGQDFSVFLFNDGTVQAVGLNESGVTGTSVFGAHYKDLKETSKFIPIKDKMGNPIKNVKDISAGNSHLSMLLEDGSVLTNGF